MVTIDFSAVRPNEIGLESYQQWKDSTFQDTYKRAERCLWDIVQMKDRTDAEGSLRLKIPDSQNRVLAFVGDRGTGKTSAMVSFVKACVDGDISVFEPADRYSEKKYRCSFYTLPVIEPTSFSEGESIVGCVVSQIYSELEENHDKLDRKLVQEILNRCTDVREAIRVQGMSSQALLEQNSDELSHLRLLAQTRRLREQLEKLIDSYLTMRVVCKSKNQTGAKENGGPSYLIIPIDDIDTSIHAAYRLAEELRSYFMLPHVIVVMALKVEQLSDALEQRFINEFRDLYNAGIFLDTQPVAMAAKYIQKLIPEQRQIRMPNLSLTELSSCALRTGEKRDEPLVPYLLELVHRKVGVLLILDERGSHPLVPHNLRSLHQMLCLFRDMEDTVELTGERGRRKYLDQLEGAEKWLLNHIASSQLPVCLGGILRQFAVHPDQGVNAFLWRALARVLHDSAEPEVKALLERSVRNDNISIGDVLYLLLVLEETDVESDLALFGAAVRMLYSIRLRRGMIQSLSVEEGKPVDSALRDMPEEGYERVWRVLNGLIYDPVQRLTYDGFERMYNGDALLGKIDVSLPAEISKRESMDPVVPKSPGGEKDELRNLYGGVVRDNKDNKPDVSPMSPEEAVWSSMFIVGFGRVRNRDIHSLKSSILTDMLPPNRQRETDAGTAQNGDPAFLSCNWMAFAHNLLVPLHTASRLIWRITSQLPEVSERFRKKVDELKKVRFPILFDCLHLDSADFLHSLICHVVAHREENCQKMGNNLAVFNGFFEFRSGLIEGIGKVSERSCASVPVESLEELKRFLTVPGQVPESGGEQVHYLRYSNWMGFR